MRGIPTPCQYPLCGVSISPVLVFSLTGVGEAVRQCDSHLYFNCNSGLIACIMLLQHIILVDFCVEFNSCPRCLS